MYPIGHMVFKKGKVIYRYLRRYYWQVAKKYAWRLLDRFALLIWRRPRKYLVIRCPVCHGRIEKKRDVYILDNPLVHYYCHNCKLNQFYDLESPLPKGVPRKLVKIYYERYPELTNPRDN